MNRNRKYSYIILILILFLLTGCSGKSSSDSPSTKNQVDYAYNHELNVLDDNYRTYYEVFLYSFYDSDGDGIGDINGLISKLDYINDGDPNTDTDMGFNGIWLMPIMPSTTYHKYDVIDYYKIDPQYGTMEDFKNLIKECDKRGIKVIIDLVLNHTSTKNEWFLSATNTLTNDTNKENSTDDTKMNHQNKYCNYYNFVKGRPASGSYYQVNNSDWFYEGVFWDQMPDLNLEDRNLRKDIEDIMQFWLDLGVGGFRLDAAKEFYSGSIEKNIEVLDWVNQFVKSKSQDNYLVAEVWEGFSNYSKYYQSGIDSIFNFAFAQESGKIVKTLNLSDSSNSGKAFGEAMIIVQDTIKKFNKNAIDAPFFTNHDTGRAAGLLTYNENKIKMAAGMNLMMSGNVFVYYGEELGMSGSGIDENKRAPMYWSTTNLTGMTVGPKDMQLVEHRFGPLDEQMEDKNSIWNYYKRATRLRNENPEIARGTISYLTEVTDIDVCAITKTYNGDKLIMLYNCSENNKEITLSKDKFNYEGIRGYLTVNQDSVTIKNDVISLPPYSIVILK